jgi:cytochrome c-type biogenesis protein CcmH/NrfG
MGLITGLLTLPLAPVRGVAWIGEVLQDEAQRQLDEANSPERRLAELDVLRASGEVTDEEAEAIEAEIVEAMLEREEPT